MEKYIILSVKGSIVMPDMVDVKIAKDGHFVNAVRLPNVYEKSLLKNAEIILHKGAGESMAYCFGNEMYYAAPRPVDIKDARRQLSRLAGLGRGSLDRFRFYMALRAVLAYHGIRPSLSGTKNLMRLINIQEKMRDR